ncbi:ABC transporter substrate-binding protein [Paracoccus sp. YIM 132242]|uniref:ABC transporter substrate-binding protein n=1 Tax=Paracoccus lichenicola TaxID=2665644 RepID=A0A6L6HQQ2_9RHOB|nr:ABC transporter substrate-binding protein [Paracoccus lichenicola]MTE01477.1 ABC transporter substrate-binding protein [Paracoccus lichenicola]
MRIGVILSHGGLAGLWTPGCQGAALVAAAELNAQGGVLGQEVRIILQDSGETAHSARAAAERLVVDERADAVIGLQASHLRSAVRDGLHGLAPYVYTPHYEGGHCGPGVVTLGVTDAEVLNPAIAWLAEHRGVSRVFFAGNDYIWPRVAHGTAETAVRLGGARMVGHALLSLHGRDYAPVMAAIAAARPDLVVVALLGEDAVAFNRAFADAGLSQRVLRLALAFEETQLLGVAPENAENLFATASYFSGITGHGRERLLDEYRRSFAGRLPDVTTNSLNCYDAIHLVAGLARHVGRVDGHLMARVLRQRIPRSFAYRMIGRSEISARVALAEADGTGFRVRQSWMA